MLEALIPDYAYKLVYLLFTGFLLLVKTVDNKGFVSPERGNTGYRKAIWLGILFIIFFGLRPINSFYMADTGGYATWYNWYSNGTFKAFDFSNGTYSESLWIILRDTLATHHFDVAVWFTAVAAIYIIFNLLGIRRMFRGNEYTAFLFFISFFIFYSGGINGIRNACGYSIVFYAMTFYGSSVKHKYIKIAALCFAGYLFHGSVLITIAGMIGSATVVKSTKRAIAIWLCAIVLSLALGNTLANYIGEFSSDERTLGYLASGANANVMERFSHTGFRWDFLLFSALPIVLGYYVTIMRGITDKTYTFFLNTYILANAVWIVFIYAAFSNRYAMLSWCLYPYILFYPFAKLQVWPRGTASNRALALIWLMFVFTIII